MAIKEDERKVFTNVHGGTVGGKQPAVQAISPAQVAANAAKKRFMKAGSGLSQKKANMMPKSMQGMASQVMGQAGQAATRRISQVQSLMPQKKPELISYETNPNMDWRQAAALNQEAMKGYNSERGVVIGAIGGMGRADIAGQAGMDQVKQRGANLLASGAQVGRNRLNQVAAQGNEIRKTGVQTNANTAANNAQQNIWNKEKDNRNLITQALTRGAPMNEQAQNAYNTGGEHNIDISGMQIPQRPVPQQKQIYVQPKFDKDGVVRQGTGVWAMPPGQNAAQAIRGGQQQRGLSPGFDPMNPSQEDSAYLRSLAESGQYDLLQQIEQQYLSAGR